MNYFRVVIKKPGIVHSKIIPGESTKQVRKQVRKKLQGTAWSLQYVHYIEIDDHIDYDDYNYKKRRQTK